MFYNTLIKADRWLWYVEGIGRTVLISIGAIAIGVIIGIIVALIKYVNKKFGNFKVAAKVCDFYLTIFRGTPVYVQLLIMYFVVLVALPTLPIAIITFGINSGAYVAEIIRGGLESVDDGQIEAGASLGLTKLQIMIQIPDSDDETYDYNNISLNSCSTSFLQQVRVGRRRRGDGELYRGDPCHQGSWKR